MFLVQFFSAMNISFLPRMSTEWHLPRNTERHCLAIFSQHEASIFHDEIAPLVFKLLNLKGIINFGGKSQSVFKFAKKYNSKIKKISYKKIFGKFYPSNTTMNMTKFKKYLKKDKKI